MLISDKANKEKRVRQNILEHSEQKLLVTNQELLQSANVTNAFWKNSRAEMLGILISIKIKGVVHRKWPRWSHHPLKKTEGVIPK